VKTHKLFAFANDPVFMTRNRENQNLFKVRILAKNSFVLFPLV
jgi:hypothetical protein